MWARHPDGVVTRILPAIVHAEPYPGRMDETGDAERDDLLTRLEVIEAQPLATRAEAYDALHDTLARRLEAGPAGTAAAR